jgi:hypothetical protein
MTEIKHWLDEASDADDFERAILRCGTLSDPSDAQRDEVWSNLLGALAVAPALAPAASTTAAKTAVGGAKAAAVWLGVGKGFVAGLAIYGAASGVSAIAEHFRAQTSPVPIVSNAAANLPNSRPARQPSVLTAPVAPPASVEPGIAPSALTVPSVSARTRFPEPGAPPLANALPSVAAFAPNPESTANGVRESQLKAEAAALGSAREALRAGRLKDAYAQLEASRRQFSVPELYQEREALTIELLSRSGQVAAAGQRANAFLSRFPESPHADQIRRFVAPH